MCDNGCRKKSPGFMVIATWMSKKHAKYTLKLNLNTIELQRQWIGWVLEVVKGCKGQVCQGGVVDCNTWIAVNYSSEMSMEFPLYPLLSWLSSFVSWLLSALALLSAEDKDEWQEETDTVYILYFEYSLGVWPYTNFLNCEPTTAWFIKGLILEGRGGAGILVTVYLFEL